MVSNGSLLLMWSTSNDGNSDHLKVTVIPIVVEEKQSAQQLYNFYHFRRPDLEWDLLVFRRVHLNVSKLLLTATFNPEYNVRLEFSSSGWQNSRLFVFHHSSPLAIILMTRPFFFIFFFFHVYRLVSGLKFWCKLIDYTKILQVFFIDTCPSLLCTRLPYHFQMHSI